MEIMTRGGMGRQIQANKKAGRQSPAFEVFEFDELRSLDVARLFLTLIAGGNLKGDLLPLLQRLETRHRDRRKMNEQVLAPAIGSDKTEALRIVEPFNSTSCHFVCP